MPADLCGTRWVSIIGSGRIILRKEPDEQGRRMPFSPSENSEVESTPCQKQVTSGNRLDYLEVVCVILTLTQLDYKSNFEENVENTMIQKIITAEKEKY